MRTSVALVVCGCFWSLFSGCSHMAESRVVDAFSKSLKDHDLAELKQQASPEFEKKAVVGDETFEILKTIDLPEGKQKVRTVKDTKDDKGKEVVEKLVTVEVRVGKTGKRKVWYRLKRDGADGKWVVDDIYLTKDQKDGRSLGAQMAARHGVREAIEAWKSADREKMMTVVTPEFAQILAQLSPAQLQRFARQVTEEVAEQPQIMSQERIGDETAELRVSKGTLGDLVLKFRKVEERWKLDDLKVVSRRAGGEIESAREISAAMSAALAFRDAYRSNNMRQLEKVTTPQFFEGSLAAADLSQVPLPGAGDGHENFDVKLDGKTATFIVSTGSEVLKISLARGKPGLIHQTPPYLVEDVTIYELDGSQNKRLSALFTGHATMAAFSAAIAANDLKTLGENTTHDFNERVWSQVRDRHTRFLPLAELRSGKPRIVQTDFKGSCTEILVEQGDTPLTYVLRDEHGRMLVDDVLIPSASRPESLKTNLELSLPVLKFAFALEDSDMEDVRGVATTEFSRAVWDYCRKTPDFDRDPLPHLKAPLSSVRFDGDLALVNVGSKRFGAKVVLRKEKGQYRVDDASLIFGPERDQNVGLKRIIHQPLRENHEPLEARNIFSSPVDRAALD